MKTQASKNSFSKGASIQQKGPKGPQTVFKPKISKKEKPKEKNIDNTSMIPLLSEDHSYGFNGTEMDNEVSGTGNTNTSYFRQYDPSGANAGGPGDGGWKEGDICEDENGNILHYDGNGEWSDYLDDNWFYNTHQKEMAESIKNNEKLLKALKEVDQELDEMQERIKQNAVKIQTNKAIIKARINGTKGEVKTPTTEPIINGDVNSDQLFYDNFLPQLLKHEGGYQNVSSDNGNWTGGKTGVGILVGTNHGISAPVLANYLGRTPTADDMKKLTVEQAKEIYKSNYWDKIFAGSIDDEQVAIQFGDMYVNSGGNAVKIMQRSLNDLGYNVAVDGAMGSNTLNAINNAIADGKSVLLFNTYRKNRIKFYKNLIKSNPSKYKKWEKGWLKRAKSFQYKMSTLKK